MTPCQRYQKQLFEYIEGELDLLQRKTIAQHLKGCPQCRGFLEQIRSMKSEMENLSRIQASENFHILLRERIRRERAGKRESLFTPAGFSWRWIPAAALFVVMIVSGFWMIDQKTNLLHQSVIAEANQQSTGSGMQYKGQVHYVIDDYPLSSSLSVSRDDKPVSPSTIDSLNVPQQNDGVQAYFTPVNF